MSVAGCGWSCGRGNNTCRLIGYTYVCCWIAAPNPTDLPRISITTRQHTANERQAPMLDVTGGELLVLVGAAAVFLGPSVLDRSIDRSNAPLQAPKRPSQQRTHPDSGTRNPPTHPGKKEVPQLARIIGRGTGKMVALLNTAREQFTRATQDTELSKVRKEGANDDDATFTDPPIHPPHTRHNSCTRRCGRTCTSSTPSAPSSVRPASRPPRPCPPPPRASSRPVPAARHHHHHDRQCSRRRSSR